MSLKKNKNNRNLLKAFLSTPMSGLTATEIEEKFAKIRSKITDKLREYEIEFIDSYISGGAIPELKDCSLSIWYLGKSIEFLAQADLVVFAPDWERARGCKIEHAVASEYGKEVYYLNKNQL